MSKRPKNSVAKANRSMPKGRGTNADAPLPNTDAEAVRLAPNGYYGSANASVPTSDAKATTSVPKGCGTDANASLPDSDGEAKPGVPKVHSGPANPSLTNAIDAIRAFHRERNFAMEQRKRADLALGSYLRMALGWSKSLQAESPESAQKINAMVQDIIACGEKLAKGKAHSLSDTEEFKRHERTVMAALAAREPFDAVEHEATKTMEVLAAQLPCWNDWGKGIRGFGARSLAVIVGEAGDLGAYPKKGHLWKRMGLAPSGGKAYSTWRKDGGLTKVDWIEAGYSPKRRAVMYVIGDVLVKVDGPYRAIYLARKGYERAKAAERGLTVAPSAKIPKKRAAEFISDGHIHKRAQRYMEKMLLRDLRAAWRRSDVNKPNEARHELSVSEIPGARKQNGREATIPLPNKARNFVPSVQPIERKATPALHRLAAEPRLPTAHLIAAE